MRPEVVRYGVGTEAAHQFGLPCGGTIELVLEPVSVRSRLAELLGLLERGERVRRILTLASGEVELQAGADFDELLLTDTALSTVHGPCWRMLLIGAGQMTRYLAEMAIALGYEVVVCDPREEYATGFAIAHTQLVRSMPDDAVHDFQVDAHCAVVALTHDPKLDDLALMEALNSDAFYVGAIGSRANQTKRRARLAEHFGMTEQQLGRKRSANPSFLSILKLRTLCPQQRRRRRGRHGSAADAGLPGARGGVSGLGPEGFAVGR